MTPHSFPPLPLDDWRGTRDTIRSYAQVIGKIRRVLMPKQKHWWHTALHLSSYGLTTTPMPGGNLTTEIQLDFIGHGVIVTTSAGDWFEIDLDGQPARELAEDLLASLQEADIEVDLDLTQFGETAGAYDAAAVERFWQALSQIDIIFKAFRSTFRGESGPVILWPHNFDLAMLWFSGRLVPDQEPNDPEHADEQMNFGFVTGDEGIAEPYFYITAYPWPAGLEETALPAGAYWYSEGWQGVVLPYATLLATDAPRQKLLDFLGVIHQAGAEKMI